MPRPMKDSGVKWLGDIPADWEIYRLKFLLSGPLMYGANESGIPFEENLPRYIRITDITTDGKLKDSDKLSLDADSNSEYILLDGDLLFARSGASVGKTFLFKKEYGLSAFAGYLIRARTKQNVSPKFLFYYSQSSIYDEWKNQIFIQSTIQNISAERYNNLPVPFPPLDEQQRIATFLDGECARIDSVIENTRASIVEYKKLKQSIITRAVTKGIRPNRPMKDSGVEWLGDIPSDWEIIPIKHLCSYNDEVLQESTDSDFTFDYIEIGSVEFGRGIIEMEHIQFANAPSRARRIVHENDIIVSTVRTYLKAVAQIPHSDTPLIASTGFVVIRPRNVNPIFLKYAILSSTIISKIESNSVGISYPAINASQVVRFKIPVPPLDEQKEIAQYLDEKTAAIDSLVANKEQLLTELERLKKSLIFEYVTGKKAVPT